MKTDRLDLFSNGVAGYFAPDAATNSLTAAEISIVRDSYDRISVGRRFAFKFYARLFEIAPETRALFPDDLTQQVAKLMQMLGALVEHLDQPHELARLLIDLGQRHRGYGVSSAQFAPVGRALLETLATELGPGFDGAMRSAWLALYALAASLMKLGFEDA